MDGVPRNAKALAVAQWRSAVADIDDGAEYKDVFDDADIHRERDRREIEETIEHDVSDDYYNALADAFHDLKSTFGWSE